jgi:hypothetical protein
LLLFLRLASQPSPLTFLAPKFTWELFLYYRLMLTLEHLDPKQHPLICGLCNEHNEILADASYNYSKGAGFVPYKISDLYPAPENPGDIGEFLIRGGWMATEFLGEWWWIASNEILVQAKCRGGPPRVDWPQRIKSQEDRWNCKILVCSPTGRFTKRSLAIKICPHEVSKPKPLWFLTRDRIYCCRTHQNRSLNAKKSAKNQHS